MTETERPTAAFLLSLVGGIFILLGGGVVSMFGPFGFGGMMGYGNQASSTMTISKDKAQQLAQTYLDANFKGAKTEMATQFYGYYTFDFEKDGKIQGMFSVNGYTGQTWYHGWHGAFIDEKEF